MLEPIERPAVVRVLVLAVVTVVVLIGLVWLTQRDAGDPDALAGEDAVETSGGAESDADSSSVPDSSPADSDTTEPTRDDEPASGGDGDSHSESTPVDGETSAAADGGNEDEEPTPEPTQPRTITLAFTGELLSHGNVIERARLNGSPSDPYDYRPMFAQVRPLLSEVDLAICHQETPISTDNTGLAGYPIFNAPAQLADAIAWAGWDACSTASNHSLDQGFAGVVSTLDQLDRAGVGHAGMARTAAEASTPSLYTVGDIVVGHLSYSYGTNGIPLPAEAPWAVDVIDADAILAEAAAARAAGADIVVMSVQWGAEYQTQPIIDQTALAERLLASPDVDLIVGSHVHVPQPMDRIGAKYVLYGLGNFVSNQSPVTCAACPQATEDGMILRVSMAENATGAFEVDGLEVVPTWVDRRTYTVIPTTVALADPALEPDLRPILQASWQRTADTVRSIDPNLPLLEIAPLPDPPTG